MISVLFVARNSVYKTMSDSAGEPIDCWDEERDAMKWPGGNPIVAHPPCRLFCAMRHLAKATPKERDKERYFAHWAVEQVRKEGGALEHPAMSLLWKHHPLPKPGSSDRFGLSIAVNQWWFGFPARKTTWLYICGADSIPPIPLRIGEPEFTVSFDTGQAKKGLTTYRQRSATPPAFAHWLVETAERCQKPIPRTMEKIITVNGREQSVIECHGDCVDPVRIRIHLDPNPKPKEKKDDSDQMRLDLRFKPK